MGDHPPMDTPADILDTLLRGQRPWQSEPPVFDPADTPAEPLPLFVAWFAEAVEAGQPEPHTLALATVDADDAPDVRTVTLRGADARGWRVATRADSRKGRQLAASPRAALGFHWPARSRQIRVRGPVLPASPEESRADLRARSTGALAAALTGRQSAPLGSLDELARASAEAWRTARAEPERDVPQWTVYVVAATEVEFWQGDPGRRHVRLVYRRPSPRSPEWTRQLLWP
ncbi:oxidase [Streptomyces gougerotii]|uniref:Oxidase n=4 Tax=Streptomyces TaxID=1883 RepID=A0A6A0CEM2_9ACTN|nr:pyridoxal 5'-phosphate synthase [Streptomyces sp. BRB081]NEE41211.1 pyridoxal 5'-phosphate synthase [Streptomyces sp. SID7982]QNE82609.1 pyridoxal 5'-phosphate synthase [Streptomyces rutgersensis]GFH69686.1 oxidase [Streptomyces diastaticus subsp. diastaticus]GFH76418.1 oxidase [Streptomyces gougerotii]